MATEERSVDLAGAWLGTKSNGMRPFDDTRSSIMSLMTEAARKPASSTNGRSRAETSVSASKYVLKEARCNDDNESSGNEDEEDEDTDLSGFIVDDDAELSYYESSASDSDEDHEDESVSKATHRKTAPRRRLHRGPPTRRRLSFKEEESESDKEKGAGNRLSIALQNMCLDERSKELGRKLEVIDLTSSPATSPKLEVNTTQDLNPTHIQPTNSFDLSSYDSNPFKDFDSILKLSHPLPKPELVIPPTEMAAAEGIDAAVEEDKSTSVDDTEAGFATPPITPPQSPSKLNSPSKLLSPSKRQNIPQSPHRQSMDAFWDHNVINEWNDEYSPKKTPAVSPRKVGLARFQIWSDSEDEEDKSFDSSDSLPSPLSSPRKSTVTSRSPPKSPEKEEKRRLAEEKKVAAARKKSFDNRKHQLAVDLLCELDLKITNSQLEKLAASTGGVHVKWSKTLRSTAGRANWKRTITKLSGSPIKGGDSSGAGVTVQHYASIELAEKIIDCEDRLVNTLAHEFCHLANFMISDVRDQPHGASFKEWAAKVTRHLRHSDVEIWRSVQVTTKHSYVINHKYLWVCVGRDRTSAMDFLNIDEEEGCGAEYGRHSKSIDTEKHRCGKCRGRLLQVKPKPRASPKKAAMKRNKMMTTMNRASSAESTSSSSNGLGLGALIETVELSD